MAIDQAPHTGSDRAVCPVLGVVQSDTASATKTPWKSFPCDKIYDIGACFSHQTPRFVGTTTRQQIVPVSYEAKKDVHWIEGSGGNL